MPFKGCFNSPQMVTDSKEIEDKILLKSFCMDLFACICMRVCMYFYVCV